MIKIERTNQDDWDYLEKTHSDNFYQKIWNEKNCQSLINKLKPDEKKFFYDLFGDANLGIDIAEEKIKSYIISFDLSIYQKMKSTFDSLCGVDENKTLKKEIVEIKDNYLKRLTEEKCDKFWDELNSKISELNLTDDNKVKIIGKLKKDKSILKFQGYNHSKYDELKLLINSYKNLLINTQEELQTVIDQLKIQFKTQYSLQESFYEKLDKNFKDKSEISFSETDIKFKSRFKETVDYIFSYDNLPGDYSKNPEWNRHLVISKMGVHVCPYCNRQYITSYTEKDFNNINVTADLDHLHPKSLYPYLAMSLYNFIPSCQICNRVFKLEQEGHLNPYIEDFGSDARFSIENISTVLDKTESLEINILKFSDPNGSIEKSLQIFRLREVYRDSHNQYILDMYRNLKDRQGDYAYFTSQGFDFSGQNKEFLEKFYIDLAKKPYVNRIKAKEPLSRLTEDIMKQLGVGID